MPKVNLLFVITKLELGGAQKQLLTLVKYLDRTRYNLFLFTARQGLLLQEALSIEGLEIHRSSFLERRVNPIKDFLALIELYFFIRRHKIGIVHTHSSKAGILGRWAAVLAGVKAIVHTVHGWSFNDYQPGFYRKISIWLERITASFTDKLLVISDYDRQRGLANRIGELKQYAVIRYGIDREEFNTRDISFREELGLVSQDLVVGMIACFKPQKCPQDFIKLAFLINQELPGVKFILVGDGVLRDKIEKLIQRFNLTAQVILTGWRRDIPRVLSAIDVFVLTSLWEGLPISVLEAMFSGKPVVATQTGGISEIITEGKTGFLVSPRQMDKMAQEVTRLLRDKKQREEIGGNAKNSLLLDFGIDKMVKNTEALYDEVRS